VTKDRFDYRAPSWSPDATRLAAVAARHPDFDLTPFDDIWVVDVARALAAEADDDAAFEPRQLTATDASHKELAWEPDGHRIACLRTAVGIGYRHARLALVDSETGDVNVLTDKLDRTCAPFPGVRPPIWDGDRLIVSIEDHGRVPVIAVPLDGVGADPVRLVEGDRCVGGFDHAGGTLAFVASSIDEPSELYVVRDGVERCLTRHQATFDAAVPSLSAERFTVRAADGTELDAWAILPPDFDRKGSYAALLNIHGGPHTQYGDRWFDEFQLYASAGHVVLFSNPRGSTGYDEASARVLISGVSSEDPGEGWGPPAHDDLMRVVDAALERYPAIDADRLGVMGGSYGGYMTSWVIGHTNRFAAAISERGVNNVASLEWSSDAAGYFRFAMGATHLDAPDEYARLSPITYVREITTPVLIIHSEDDLRCPVEQADALFVALRLLGKKVEFVRFPAESHELTRGGSPKHRIQRAEIVLDWFARELGPSR
jgi:dipeptidyl aminopeptidase/acylaminoacyl peptidase